ncbi:MAG: hypothetical protein JWQ70_1362 [Aeromicrobium sp.]|nr:hypothetical protein [Aeromicrobium sp.]
MAEDGASVVIDHWVWDAAHSSVERTMDRAKIVMGAAAVVATALILAVGWSATSGIARESLVIYGTGAGIAIGYAARVLYVAATVRWAVEPVRNAIVPALLPSIDRVQVAHLIVNRGSWVDQELLHAVDQPGGSVEVSHTDLAEVTAEHPQPRRSVWYYASGSLQTY